MLWVTCNDKSDSSNGAFYIWAISWEEGPQFCAVWNPSNVHVQPLIRVRDVALSLKLPLTPFVMWANSEGSGESAQMRRLAWAFAVGLCDKYPFLMCWLILPFYRRIMEHVSMPGVRICNLCSHGKLESFLPKFIAITPRYYMGYYVLQLMLEIGEKKLCMSLQVSHLFGTNPHISLVTRKLVFGICDQVRLKPACAASETS